MREAGWICSSEDEVLSGDVPISVAAQGAKLKYENWGKGAGGLKWKAERARIERSISFFRTAGYLKFMNSVLPGIF